MTLNEFVTKYDGQKVDVDGFPSDNPYQCMDLYRKYVKEVLGYPQSPPVEGAKDVWDTYLPEYYTRIENTPTGVPEKGDIIIFGTGLGRWGHIAIFLEGNASRFTSFDQNYPTGSPAHKQGHTYSAVIGWLRPKDKKMEIPQWFNTLLQEEGLSLEREGEFRAFWEKAKRYDEDIKNLQEQVKSNSDALADRAREVSVLTEQVQSLKDDKDQLQDKLNQKGIEVDSLNGELRQALFEKDVLEARAEKDKSEIEDLSKRVDTLLEENKALRIDLDASDAQKIHDISLIRFILLKIRGGDSNG